MARYFQFWDRPAGRMVAEFDHQVLADDTPFPFVVQTEQHKLARMGLDPQSMDYMGNLGKGMKLTAISMTFGAAALAGIARCLKPGGKFVMTVPAHQWMWSAHDVVNHHQRRYSKSGLEALFRASPLKLEKMGYLNSLLLPVAIAARAAGKVTGKDDGDDTLPPAPLNAALEKVFAQEARLIGRVPLPPGLSLWAVASSGT